ncbi:MAG: hypothetical protein JNG84_01660, partial [Archangium sp.]|nr:hypothetical protein [Archangium sp.]
MLAVLIASACATPLEAEGDRARSEGNTARAVRSYTAALNERPMMDFEFERVRDKRKALVEGEWGPKLDQLVAAVGTPPLERVAALLMYRRQARDARVTIALAQRIDEVLLKAATPELLQAKTPSDVPTRLNALLALFDQARSTAAPLAVLEACAAAFSKSLAVGFPPVTGSAGVERLSTLLKLRDDVRTR